MEIGFEQLTFFVCVYLNHVNVISESIQGHFKNDFCRQFLFIVKDHVSLQRSNLVVTRKLSSIHEISNLIALKGVKNFLPQSEKNNGKIKGCRLAWIGSDLIKSYVLHNRSLIQ